MLLLAMIHFIKQRCR